jgi:probable rRNA maturation factor
MAAARLHVNVACPDSPSQKTSSAKQAGATRGLGAWLVKIAPASARGELCVALVSDRRMRALNRQFRGKDAVTDVLSFPAQDRPVPSVSSALSVPSTSALRATADRSVAFLGDIVIADGVAKRQAKAAGHGIQTEIRVLALHGLLHLLGYDHDGDDGKMARAEARLRKKAGLPAGLIERQG